MESIATGAPPRCTPPPVLFVLRGASQAYRLTRAGRSRHRQRGLLPGLLPRQANQSSPRITASKQIAAKESAELLSFVGGTQVARLESLARRPTGGRASPGSDADQTTQFESETRSTDGIPESHRLTALETKLLTALQEVLLDEIRILAAIHGYRIPVTGRKKKAATARREGRSRRSWQIPATAYSDRAPGAAAASGI